MRASSRLSTATLGLVLVSAACADPAAPTTPAMRPAAAGVAGDNGFHNTVDATRQRLERAAAGLLYTSESDYPFEYVFLPARAQAPLTAAAFRDVARVPADSAVEEVSIDEFFARHIERVDPADSVALALVPRYEALKRTIRTAVRGVRVFRVGRVAIRCYVVGVDLQGNVVGLATRAIET